MKLLTGVGVAVLIAVGYSLEFNSISLRNDNSYLSKTSFASETTSNVTPEIQVTGFPDFTKLMSSEGATVVNISAVQKANPMALNPLDLLRRLQPQEDEDEMEKEFKRPSPKEKPQSGIGSGFFISRDGFILTNAHVVKKADVITVKTLDRKEYKAVVVGFDTRTDIALLKIEASSPTPMIRTGKPNTLKTGEWVAAIGSPFGFENTVTAGIVSAFDRYLPDENYLPFIQTDVAINPGNSGGPLFNVRGEVIGVNTQIYSRSGGYMGLSFSIPIDAALTIADQLRSKGKVERSRMGVRIEGLNATLAQALGLSISDGVAVLYVEPESPAAKAGLMPGDVITAFKKELVDTPQKITRLISETPPNTSIPLTIVRGKDEKVFNVTVLSIDALALNSAVKKVPKLVIPKMDVGPLGFVVEGNKVVELSDTAKDAGLAVGDNIMQIQQTPIASSADVQKWLSRNKDFENVAIFIKRESESKFVILPKTESRAGS